VGWALLVLGGPMKLLSLDFLQGEWDIGAGGRVSPERQALCVRQVCSRSDRVCLLVACLLTCLLAYAGPVRVCMALLW
jgi:hypothetical protein